MQTSIIMPCLNCAFDCGLNEDLSFIWNNSAEPSDDPDFSELVNALVSTLSELVKTRQVATSDGLGVALAALFDLCVSLEYAKLVTDTDWVYCPVTQQHGEPLLFYPYVKACPGASAKS